MSDNISRWLLALVLVLVPALSLGQDLEAVVDADAYAAARSNYRGLYLHIDYEPASSGPNSSSIFNLIEYTSSRPASFNTVSRFGFQSGSGSVTERYILAEGDSVLLANNDFAASTLEAINSNLARFGLATTEERQAKIAPIENDLNGASVPLLKFVSFDFKDAFYAMIRDSVVVGLCLILAVYVVQKGVRLLMRLAGKIDDMDRRLER